MLRRPWSRSRLCRQADGREDVIEPFLVSVLCHSPCVPCLRDLPALGLMIQVIPYLRDKLLHVGEHTDLAIGCVVLVKILGCASKQESTTTGDLKIATLNLL